MVVRAFAAGFLTMLGLLFLGQVLVRPGPASATIQLLDYAIMPGVAFMRLIGYGRTHDPDFWVFAMLANSLAYAAVFLVAFLLLGRRKGKDSSRQ